MNEQQKARIVELAQQCESYSSAAEREWVADPFNDAIQIFEDGAERASAEAFRIAQQ